MAVFVTLASGDRVNLGAVLYVREYNDPVLGTMYRLHFAEREIITVKDAEDVKKIREALDRLELLRSDASE